MNFVNKYLAAVLMGVCGTVAQGANVTVADFSVSSGTDGTNSVRVYPEGASVQNPNSCSTPDSYAVDSALPVEVQRRVYSALLSASSLEDSVVLRISGCTLNRPRILDVIF